MNAIVPLVERPWLQAQFMDQHQRLKAAWKMLDGWRERALAAEAQLADAHEALTCVIDGLDTQAQDQYWAGIRAGRAIVRPGS